MQTRHFALKEIRGVADRSLQLDLQTGAISEQHMTPDSVNSEIEIIFRKKHNDDQNLGMIKILPKFFRKRRRE
ncbi:hypothetical protein [Lactobacillus kalixensis]|uniref:Uncharacterized protein n=1 Tax=Lactobacillus kalixensis DSM 16043 TaxID=1423763 RepID=A0A0R1U8K8_9LACO|nr:hypothetical protein [Lactobacillus kalixensis]KRL89633.1 hypothetical protein FC46_GL000736 [Lactobacillus kalixensis DSM 16043]